MNTVQSPLFDHVLAIGVSQGNNPPSKAHDNTESPYNKTASSYGRSELSYGKPEQQDSTSDQVISRAKEADFEILPVPKEERYTIQPVVPDPVDVEEPAERERTGILVGLASVQNQNKNIEALLDGLDHSVEEGVNSVSFYEKARSKRIRSGFLGRDSGVPIQSSQDRQAPVQLVHTRNIGAETSLGQRIDIRV